MQSIVSTEGADDACIEEILCHAVEEGRRRVKEQLKKMGSFEYYHRSFSFLDTEIGEEPVRPPAQLYRFLETFRRGADTPRDYRVSLGVVGVSGNHQTIG